jgi:hypothetical protein
MFLRLIPRRATPCGKVVDRGNNGRKRNWRIAFREHRRRLTEESVSATLLRAARSASLTSSGEVRERLAPVMLLVAIDTGSWTLIAVAITLALVSAI